MFARMISISAAASALSRAPALVGLLFSAVAMSDIVGEHGLSRKHSLSDQKEPG